MTAPISKTSFAASQPRQAAFIVYINGIEVPAKSVNLRFGVWQMPEMQIEMTADPVLMRLGAEDRVQVVVFYLDDCDVVPGVKPEFRLFGEGEITGWGYRNTGASRSIMFTVVNQIAIYTQLTVSFLNTFEDLVGDARDPARGVINLSTPSSRLVYPLALFTQGLLETGDAKADFIKRPFDFLYNTVRGMIDARIPEAHQAIPASNFFARWSRLTNFHNRFVASPFFDEVAAGSDNIFPVLKAVQSVSAVSAIVKNLIPNVQNSGSIWDMLEVVIQTLLTEIAMIPSMPLVTVDLATSLILPTNFNEHILVQAPGYTDELLTVIGGQVRTFGGTPITGLVNGHAIDVDPFTGAATDGVTGAPIEYSDTLESASAKANARKWVPALSIDSRKTAPKRIPNYFVKPQSLFSIPPSCNAIFPSQLLDMSYQENYATQPTRLYFNDGTINRLLHQVGPYANAVMDALAIGYPPEVDLLERQRPASATYNAKNFLIFPEEFFKGPVMDRRDIPPWMFFLSAQENHINPKPADGSAPASPPPARTSATPPPQPFTPAPPLPTVATGNTNPTLPLQGRWVWPVSMYNGRKPIVSQGFNRNPGSERGVIHPGQDFFFERIRSDPYPDRTPNRSKNFVMPNGVSVLAAADGVIWSAGKTGVGYSIVISHEPLKVATYYTHMTSMFVEPTQRANSGQRVKAGTPLGIIGYSPTDEAKLMHLHFELWFGGATDFVDPARFQKNWEYMTAGQPLPAAAPPPATPQSSTSVQPPPAAPTSPAPSPAAYDTAQEASDTVYKLYAKFEYFRERYAKRNGSASVAWNPYVVAGFPGVILDQRASRVDLFCYITTVQQTMSHDGRRGTQLSFSYGRQLQEMFQQLSDEFSLNDATARGSAPQEPIRDVSKVLQSFPQAETYYQNLFYGAQPLYGKDASFDFRNMLAYAPKVPGASPEQIYVDGPDAVVDDAVVQATQVYANLLAERTPLSEKVVLLQSQIQIQLDIIFVNTLSFGSTQTSDSSPLDANNNPNALVSIIKEQQTATADTTLADLNPQLKRAQADLAALDTRINSTLLVKNQTSVNSVTRVSHNLGGANANRELVPTPRSAQFFNSRDAAMRYNWRPICTLDEYVVFLNSAGEGAVPSFGHAHSVGARYFQRIRRIEYQPLPLDPPPGVTGLDSPAVTGLTSTSFSQTRSDWDTALLAYRNNVLAIKTPRT